MNPLQAEEAEYLGKTEAHRVFSFLRWIGSRTLRCWAIHRKHFQKWNCFPVFSFCKAL